MSDARTSDLPRPLYDDWPLGQRAAAQALWDWHSGLAQAQPLSTNGQSTSGAAFYEEEKERALQGEPMRLLREEIWRPAYRVCEEYDLSHALLADQVQGARVLQGRLRFEESSELNDFLRAWVIPLSRLLAGLAGIDQKWHLSKIDELGRGFFFVGHLAQLPSDLAQNQLFIPMDDLEQAGVTVEQLREGHVGDDMRRLLWKQSIRARDALGQGQPLIQDVPSWRLRFALKRWWLGALEILAEIENSEYDVWSDPPELTFLHKARVYLQSFFGKAATRSR